jgi:hypothetical protein
MGFFWFTAGLALLSMSSRFGPGERFLQTEKSSGATIAERQQTYQNKKPGHRSRAPREEGRILQKRKRERRRKKIWARKDRRS